MSIQNNQIILDKAWELAIKECDQTCPDEIIREKAQHIFENLLVLN